MKKHEEYLIDLLKASIYNKRLKLNNMSNSDWKKLFNEAEAHKVISLVYSAIDRESINNIDIYVINNIKRRAFKSNVTQLIFINNVKKIINDLKKMNIEIIVLKGLVIRNFYDHPEFRTMSDADILVKNNEYAKVKEYLLNNGYIQMDEENILHESFIINNIFKVELHKKIINNNYIKSNKTIEFEKDIWNRKKIIKIDNIKTNTLCIEDFIIHLCIHLAVHSKVSGFGLRQLYDLALISKNKDKNINWSYVRNYINEFGILKFTEGLFKLNNKIFYVDIPKVFNKNKIRDDNLNLLLKNVIISGVYGRKNNVIDFDCLSRGKIDNYSIYNKYNETMKLDFYENNKMKIKEQHLKIRILSLPIICIYIIIKAIFIKKYKVKNLIKYTKDSAIKNYNRTKLLKVFELQ